MIKRMQDGKIAVLHTSTYGLGWYTEHGIEALLYDPNVIDLVGDYEAIERYCLDRYNTEVHAADLVVCLVPLGTRFRVEEYDGKERIKLQEDYKWLTA